jgi:ribosome biogenesis protein SLX9
VQRKCFVHLLLNPGLIIYAGLEASQSPYSKSHHRRLRRKQKNELGSGLADVATALSAVEDQVPEAVKNAVTHEQDAVDVEDVSIPRRRPVPRGQIGEGKGTTLTQAQRKRAL